MLGEMRILRIWPLFVGARDFRIGATLRYAKPSLPEVARTTVIVTLLKLVWVVGVKKFFCPACYFSLRKQRNKKSKGINITIVDINQVLASEELSTTETLSISGGSWVSSAGQFATSRAFANQSMSDWVPDFVGYFAFVAYRALVPR